MNNRQLYLAWLRTRHPKVYVKALNAVFRPSQNLMGLGDDPAASVTDTSAYWAAQADQYSAAADPITVAAQTATSAASSSGSSWADFFTGLTQAVASIAPTVVQTEAQQNLLKVNTQRASQGWPPLTANGVPVSAAQLAPANSTIAKLEASLGGGGIGVGAMIAVGAGLLLLAARRGRHA